MVGKCTKESQDEDVAIDALWICANLARSKALHQRLSNVVQEHSAKIDELLAQERLSISSQVRVSYNGAFQYLPVMKDCEPEIHKVMVLFLSRLYEYTVLSRVDNASLI